MTCDDCCYRLLLLAFPRRVRREFGDDMARMFEAGRGHAEPPAAALTAFWLRAVADALVHGGARAASARGDRWRDGVIREARRWRWYMHAFVQDIGYALRLSPGSPA